MADTELELQVNGLERIVEADPDTPLLYVLSDELGLQGPRYGCGKAQCGACSILLDDVEVRSCVTPLSAARGKTITTLEGIPDYHARQQGLDESPELSPLQTALIEEQALQCGFCYNGMIIKATELLQQDPDPSEARIREAMNGHLCRCGTYPAIVRAIRRASTSGQMMSGEDR